MDRNITDVHVSKALSGSGFLKEFKKQKFLHLMAAPGIIWLIIFCYIPALGLITAFQEYDPIVGILKSPFVGLDQFKELLVDDLFWSSFRNTIGLSLIKIVFSITAPILFALLLNEIGNIHAKKIVQTASYLPHFISWVVVAGIFTMWLDKDGVVNQILLNLQLIKEPQSYLNTPGSFWILMAVIDTWKETGWWAIIYLAALAGIPVEMYEAAKVDGAGRIRMIFSITLPSIKSTIMIVTVLSIGSMIYGGLSGSNLNQSLLFGNVLNQESSQILESFIIKMGMAQSRFSFAAAAGLIQSVVSLGLFSAANYASRKLSQTSLY